MYIQNYGNISDNIGPFWMKFTVLLGGRLERWPRKLDSFIITISKYTIFALD